jgi:CheY-like chemotaxis protein
VLRDGNFSLNWASFPVAGETKLSSARVRPVFARECSVKAILFVDDHEVLARLSCEILEMQGYRAVSAYNAADALAKFEQERFDLLVTDFRMDGMNGLELAKKIHAKDPQIPVIIVTGYGPIEGGKDVNACLSKDELFPNLLEKIKLYLGESDARQDAEPVELKSGS